MRKAFVRMTAFVVVIFVVALAGSSSYMLDYSLSPDSLRSDTARRFLQLFDHYPETREWVDSLRRVDALKDTFVVMPTGERHHALYINNHSRRTAVVVHGWRNCSIDFLYLARIYDRELGCNVVVPDLHAHGLSEGDAIQMGWLDKDDVIRWMEVFKTDTMVVHGVSMGGATTMMVSGEPCPAGVKDLRFVDDCGYTSVWEEFGGELKNQFGLPEFPLLYSTSLLCRLRYGWSFGEASAVSQVGKCSFPVLFIHGDRDTFVPTEMVYKLYAAKPSPKQIWVTEGSDHAHSYKYHKQEYVRRVKAFCFDKADR